MTHRADSRGGGALSRHWRVFVRGETPVALLTALIAGGVFLPYLGAVGLWDPWETHYGEVARQMVARGDLIHPFWEYSWFFSKPPLTFWLSVPGLWLTGAGASEGVLSRTTEWALRLPFALLAVGAVATLSQAVGRLASRRAGLVTGLALCTMPLYLLVARQAMTDMPFVATLTLALSASAIALLDPGEAHPRRWWLGAAAAAGLATLAKGLLGLLLPLAILGAFLLATGLARDGLWPHLRWLGGRSAPRLSLGEELRRIPWLPVAAVFAGVAVPWYAAMLWFDGRDLEQRTFFQRFFLHDHFARLTTGVHTTTPGGTFAYFLEQGGFAVFPWVALVPAALRVGSQVRFDATAPAERLAALAMIWVVGGFTLFSSSATRFHHYLLPVLPGLAVLVGLAVDRLLREDWKEWAATLVLGASLFGLVARDLYLRPRHLVDLFTYNHARPYPDFLWTRSAGLWPGLDAREALGLSLLLAGAAILLAALGRARQRASGGFAGLALVFALWLSWSHWVELSHHWTQRDLFWRYAAQRRDGEPIAAYLMDWKGETFYSRNRVVQIKPGQEAEQLRRLFSQPGRVWILVEHSRLAVLHRMVAGARRLTTIDPRVNNKFVLVVAE